MISIDDKMARVCLKAIQLNGSMIQMMKTIEEMSELSTELARFVTKPDGKSNNKIIEEIADVFITVSQMAMIHDWQKVEEKVAEKVKYLEDLNDVAAKQPRH